MHWYHRHAVHCVSSPLLCLCRYARAIFISAVIYAVAEVALDVAVRGNWQMHASVASGGLFVKAWVVI